MGAHTSNNTVALPVLRASETQYFCCFNVKVLSSCSSTWHTHLRTSEQCRIVRDLHGLGNPHGSRVQVATGTGAGWKFPTCQKPLPAGWVAWVDTGFFFVYSVLFPWSLQCLHSTPCPSPPPTTTAKSPSRRRQPIHCYQPHCGNGSVASQFTVTSPCSLRL